MKLMISEVLIPEDSAVTTSTSTNRPAINAAINDTLIILNFPTSKDILLTYEFKLVFEQIYKFRKCKSLRLVQRSLVTRHPRPPKKISAIITTLTTPLVR